MLFSGFVVSTGVLEAVDVAESLKNLVLMGDAKINNPSSKTTARAIKSPSFFGACPCCLASATFGVIFRAVVGLKL